MVRAQSSGGGGDHLQRIRSQTWVVEGVGRNIQSLQALEAASKNEKISFLAVQRADHFNVLAPVTGFIAKRLAKHEGAGVPSLDPAEIQESFDEARRAQREASDLQTLARLRRSGVGLTAPRTVKHLLLSRDLAALGDAREAAQDKGFDGSETREFEDTEGEPYYVLFLRKKLILGDLKAVFQASADVAAIAADYDLPYDGWGVDPL